MITKSVSKRGVLMINVGTPDEPTVESVRSYLREFLLDPDVIDAPYLCLLYTSDAADE